MPWGPQVAIGEGERAPFVGSCKGRGWMFCRDGTASATAAVAVAVGAEIVVVKSLSDAAAAAAAVLVVVAVGKDYWRWTRRSSAGSSAGSGHMDLMRALALVVRRRSRFVGGISVREIVFEGLGRLVVVAKGLMRQQIVQSVARTGLN